MAKKILLADDSITIQKVVELTFSDGDYEVIAVNNGAKAVQKLSEMRPDIILSDIIMPEKNGYEVCEYVKSHPEYRNIPVVLLTGTFEPFDPDRADKAGCDAVVTKPFESQSLIHRVEELIQQSQSAAPPAAAAPSMWPSEPEAAPFAPPPPPAAPSFAPPSPAFAPPTQPINPFTAPPAAPPANSGFSTAALPQAAPPAFPPVSDPFANFQSNANDIFGAPPAPPAETPFAAAEPFSDETRAFPRMTFDDFQKLGSAPPPASPAAAEPPAPPAAMAPPAQTQRIEPPSIFKTETSPWDESPTSGDETSFMPRSQVARPAPEPAGSAASTQRLAPLEAPPFGNEESPFSTPAAPSPFEQPAPEPPKAASPFASEPSPLDQPSGSFGDETRAFPNMTLADLQKMMDKPAPPAPEPPAFTPPTFNAPSFETPSFQTPPFEPPAQQPSSPAPFSSESSEGFGNETRAFAPPPIFQTEDAPPATPEPSPWDEQPPEGATTAFPKMDFAEMQRLASPAPRAESEPQRSDSSLWDEPAPASAPPSWSAPAAEPEREPAAAASPAAEEQTPFAESAPATSAPFMSSEEEPRHEPSHAAAAAEESGAQPSPAATSGTGTADLTEEQIDRIARRVVQLLSSDVVRNIAWEVIPDMAEMVVKERIRQLETEA